MKTRDIRKKFIEYFKSKGHKHLPSSPVIPLDDPTLLFINAGMNQFKDIFLGERDAGFPSAVTSQKCIRAGGKHNDLENVGHTTRHLTFFEMLGNFSFGDYFKKEAIAYSWEVSTEIFQLDPDKIWASVYTDDDESYELWKQHLPEKRIVRLGEEDNFWAMGDVGPCGPCSELLYDKGKSFSSADTPAKDTSGERFFEFWNLVFMQSERLDTLELVSLPKKNIDTGAGLERLMSLISGVDTVFQTDIFQALISEIEQISGKKYEEKNRETAPIYHVISDHIRTLAFSIADGAQPSNTDRGYVLRKILRRSVRYGRMLGLKEPFLAKLLPRLNAEMGEDYPELITSKDRIAELLTLEEESFIRTLQKGGNLLSKVIDKSKAKKLISGDDAFKLKDTYGFPLEEIELIAKDEEIKIDLPRYKELEIEAREKSKKARVKTLQKFSENLFKDLAQTTFVGFDHLRADSTVLALVHDRKFVDEITKGMEASIILSKTPFYAEMGGQVGDTGTISSGENLFDVEDTQAPFTGVVAHMGTLKNGTLKKGDKIKAEVDSASRQHIVNNHTATHILHWALTEILGEHIKQAGSLVEASKLRFDFNHHKALSKEDLIAIEKLVNSKIIANHPVTSYETPYDKVQGDSSIKQFFGEKYGDTVRVVDAKFCKELCGGVHTSRTGNIGLFKITKESSIAKGVRRIEAVTGLDALAYTHAKEKQIHDLCCELGIPESKLHEKVLSIASEREALSKELKGMRKAQLEKLRTSLLKNSEKEPIPLISEVVEVSSKEISPFADDLLKELKSGVIALGIKENDRCQIVIRLSADTELDAKKLIQEIAPLIKGGGGGKKTSAQAGGTDSSKLKDALEKIRTLIQNP